MTGILSQEQAGRDGAAPAGAWPAPQRPRSSWWLVLLSALAWLVLAAIVRRATSTFDAAMLLGVAALLGVSDQVLAASRCGLPPQRKLAGHALTVTLALCLTLVLLGLRGRFSVTAEVLACLLAVIVVALVGGFVPAVLEAVAGSLLLRWFVAAQPGPSAPSGSVAAARLGLFIAAAVVVGLLVEIAARRSQRAPGRRRRTGRWRRTGRGQLCCRRSATICALRLQRPRRRSAACARASCLDGVGRWGHR